MHGGDLWERTERNRAMPFYKTVLEKPELPDEQRDKDIETICATDLWNSRHWRVIFDKEKTFKAREAKLEIVKRNITKFK